MTTRFSTAMKEAFAVKREKAAADERMAANLQQKLEAANAVAEAAEKAAKKAEEAAEKAENAKALEVLVAEMAAKNSAKKPEYAVVNTVIEMEKKEGKEIHISEAGINRIVAHMAYNQAKASGMPEKALQANYGQRVMALCEQQNATIRRLNKKAEAAEAEAKEAARAVYSIATKAMIDENPEGFCISSFTKPKGWTDEQVSDCLNQMNYKFNLPNSVLTIEVDGEKEITFRGNIPGAKCLFIPEELFWARVQPWYELQLQVDEKLNELLEKKHLLEVYNFNKDALQKKRSAAYEAMKGDENSEDYKLAEAQIEASFTNEPEYKAMGELRREASQDEEFKALKQSYNNLCWRSRKAFKMGATALPKEDINAGLEKEILRFLLTNEEIGVISYRDRIENDELDAQLVVEKATSTEVTQEERDSWLDERTARQDKSSGIREIEAALLREYGRLLRRHNRDFKGEELDAMTADDIISEVTDLLAEEAVSRKYTLRRAVHLLDNGEIKLSQALLLWGLNDSETVNDFNKEADKIRQEESDLEKGVIDSFKGTWYPLNIYFIGNNGITMKEEAVCLWIAEKFGSTAEKWARATFKAIHESDQKIGKFSSFGDAWDTVRSKVADKAKVDLRDLYLKGYMPEEEYIVEILNKRMEDEIFQYKLKLTGRCKLPSDLWGSLLAQKREELFKRVEADKAAAQELYHSCLLAGSAEPLIDKLVDEDGLSEDAAQKRAEHLLRMEKGRLAAEKAALVTQSADQLYAMFLE